MKCEGDFSLKTLNDVCLSGFNSSVDTMFYHIFLLGLLGLLGIPSIHVYGFGWN